VNRPPVRQRGFGIIAAIVILVLLAGLGAAIARLGITQTANATQDMAGSRVFQTARAGIEWGLYRALRNSSCVANQTIDLRTQNGYAVTVTCVANTYNEGEETSATTLLVQPLQKTIYSITAVACNSSACPDDTAVGNSEYVERKLTATACTTAAGGFCE
jgi:MSHA biogenesis protein MshP